MAKTTVERVGMSYQHLKLIGGILIILLSIAGCSDMPYTGSMLTAEDVDRYVTIGEDSACLVVGDESTCLTLIPETQDDSRPIVHIYPGKIVYVFYREGVKVIEAEIVTDTTEIVEQIMEPVEDEPPPEEDVETTEDDETQIEADEPPPPVIIQSPPQTQPQNGDQNGDTDQNGDQNGGDGNGITEPPTQPPTQPPSNTEVKVRGESDSQSLGSGLIDLRIRTGTHDNAGCGEDESPLTVTAYWDRGRTDRREHQHWAACRDNTDTRNVIITIFLDDHPALTCDVGPNTHYLVVQGVSELIIITEVCP